MKDDRLIKVEGLTDKASNCHVLNFYFEPSGSILGLSKGKCIQVKMGLKYKASDLAIALVKTVEEIHAQLQKG